MIDVLSVYGTLAELEQLHDANQAQAHQNFLLKLALLETCGWLEDTQDQILLKLASYFLCDSELDDFKDHVKRNAGFSYDPNFRDLLKEIVGRRGRQKIERFLDDSNDFHTLRSRLNGELKIPRHRHAHSHAGVSTAPLEHLVAFTVLRDTVRRADLVFSNILKIAAEN